MPGKHQVTYLYNSESLPISHALEKVDKASVFSFPSSSFYIPLLKVLSAFQKKRHQPPLKPTVLTRMMLSRVILFQKIWRNELKAQFLSIRFFSMSPESTLIYLSVYVESIDHIAKESARKKLV